MIVDAAHVASAAARVLDEIERAVVGKRPLLQEVLAAILSGGHVLLEDYPGLGKTLIAKSFASALGLDFKRIQFTPDLLPSDITGSYVLDRARSAFELRRGPVFANLILADEINRASPKTQSALLEAMQEYQVTLEGETLPVPEPFVVLATQNPIEFEGTFPLPEAQLDRFIMKISVGYPDRDGERLILRRRIDRRQDDVRLECIATRQDLLEMRRVVEQVHVDRDLEAYIADLVGATRVDRRVAVGSSPRGSLALLKLARARAGLEGRDYILPDDVKRFAVPALAHRLILHPEFWMKRRASEEIIESILEMIPVPAIKGDSLD